jgi:hypothetical protein
MLRQEMVVFGHKSANLIVLNSYRSHSGIVDHGSGLGALVTAYFTAVVSVWPM